tara:strand:+ start:151267 stop:152172 length:906 start_codon:yes stop_codon:yes gene_type:complete
MLSNIQNTTMQASSLSKVFSPQIITELSRRGRSELLARLLKELQISKNGDYDEPLRTVFDKALALLRKKDYRHEYTYKSALTHKLLLGVHSLKTAAMITEFRVGSSKADVVILNGTSTVYEIKSERDNLDKLKRQITDYRKVFAKVNVITGENHLSDVMKFVQDDVGVLLLSKRGQISTIKEAQDLPERLSPEVIFESIQTKEASMVLKSLAIQTPKVPNTLLHETLKNEFIKLDPVDIHSAMLKVLKKTRSSQPLELLLNSLPKSLSTVVLSSKIRKKDHHRLIETMDITVNKAISWSEK